MTGLAVTTLELQAAVRALGRGEFRGLPADGARPVRTPSDWTGDGGRTVLVLGAHGGSGATTTALVIAELLRAQGEARLIECVPAPVSGLLEAAEHELGSRGGRWRVGRRGRLYLERLAEPVLCLRDVPLPPAASGWTVLDLGWPLLEVITADGWPRQALAQARMLVLVARATDPGVRRAESALDLLAPVIGGRGAIVLVGARAPDRHLRTLFGPRLRALDQARLLTCLPADRGLQQHGITTRDLPTGVRDALRPVTTHATTTPAGPTKPGGPVADSVPAAPGSDGKDHL